MPGHIVHLVQGLDTGGLEKVALHLAEGMVRRGYRATVCCYQTAGCLAPEARAAGIDTDFLPRRPGVDLKYVRRLARWLRDRRADAIHMHNETALFYGTLASILAGVGVRIYTEHDGVFPRSRPARLANRLLLVRRLTQATAVSEAVKRLWCEHDGVAAERVLVVPNGVPDPFPDGRPARPRSGGPRLGMVGRLSHEKGGDILVEAFARLAPALPDARLLIAGDGPEGPALRRRAQELGLNGRVEFLGWVGEVSAMLAGLDMLVLPSRSEGLPLAVLEAMAASLPIVATNVGGVGEAIRDGVSGLLVPPQSEAIAQAVIELANDAGQRDAFGAAARQSFLDRYELSRMIDTYERLMSLP